MSNTSKRARRSRTKPTTKDQFGKIGQFLQGRPDLSYIFLAWRDDSRIVVSQRGPGFVSAFRLAFEVITGTSPDADSRADVMPADEPSATAELVGTCAQVLRDVNNVEFVLCWKGQGDAAPHVELSEGLPRESVPEHLISFLKQDLDWCAVRRRSQRS
ncbi:MAG: hypothetical protein ABIP48_09870 [Planctomycetota bacterium]